MAYERSTRAGRLTRKDSGCRRRARSTGSSPPTRALDADRAPLYGWFADALVNTCWNAVDRHVAAGHGDQIAIIHDSPVTRSRQRHHLCRAARPGGLAGGRAAAPRASARATGSSSTCRWCPRRWWRCWPAPGWGRSIRWCSAASRRTELAVRIDDCHAQGDHRRLLRHRAGPGRALQAAARRGDRPGRRTSRISA